MKRPVALLLIALASIVHAGEDVGREALKLSITGWRKHHATHAGQYDIGCRAYHGTGQPDTCPICAAKIAELQRIMNEQGIGKPEGPTVVTVGKDGPAQTHAEVIAERGTDQAAMLRQRARADAWLESVFGKGQVPNVARAIEYSRGQMKAKLARVDAANVYLQAITGHAGGVRVYTSHDQVVIDERIATMVAVMDDLKAGKITAADARTNLDAVMASFAEI